MNILAISLTVIFGFSKLAYGEAIMVAGEKLELGDKPKISSVNNERSSQVFADNELALTTDNQNSNIQMVFVGNDVVGVIESWKDEGGKNYFFNINATCDKYSLQVVVRNKETILLFRKKMDGDKICRGVILSPNEQKALLIK